MPMEVAEQIEIQSYIEDRFRSENRSTFAANAEKHKRGPSHSHPYHWITTKSVTGTMPTIMDMLENRDLLKALAALNIVWTACRAGVALCLYRFSVPVIETGRDFSTMVMLRQFHHLISLGFKYIQTESRFQNIPLLALSWSLYRHPDPEISSKWLYVFTATLVQIQAAWYEVVFVFPINDKLTDLEKKLEKKDEIADQEMRPEVLGLLEAWRMWHIGRIVIPFAAAVVGLGGLLL
jgi:hypothetical protein